MRRQTLLERGLPGLEDCKTSLPVPCAAVGSINNTFGIKGVGEHAIFFKSIEDANRLRRQVSECFERASLPHSSQQVCCPTRS